MPSPENRNSARSAGRLVPRWLAWPVVGGSLLLAAALIPSQHQLVGRLLADGQNERALQVVRQGGGQGAFAVLPVDPLPPLEQLRAALAAGAGAPGAVTAGAIERATDPEACLELVREVEGGLPPGRRKPLYEAIIRSALARNQPALAASVAEEAELAGLAGTALRLQAVQAWRWADQPEQALAVFDRWRKTDAASLTAEAEDTEIALCRGTGRNRRALDLVLARVEHCGPPGSAPVELLELAAEIAAQAGDSAAALPTLQAWVMARPAGRAAWEELAEGKVTADAGFVKFAGLLARQCEWTGRPEEALDWYLKLGLQGDLHALARAEELQKGLNRSTDWMRLLRKVVPVAGQPRYTRQLARLLAESACYDEAPAVYERWLRDHPQDTAALSELAAMYAEMPEPARALELYGKVAALDPANLEAGKEMAELRLVLKDYQGAFAFYQNLPEEAHDAGTLENFSLLAESLGDYRACNRALLMRYHRLQQPSTEDFLELARSFELAGQPDGALTTLTEGLRRLPRSRVLRIHLAQEWRNRGNFDEAIRLLARPELKADLQAMCLFIEVCCLKEDYQTALSFLGRGFERKFGFPPDVRLDLGHIYFNNGYMTEADALYSSVPDEPSLWPLIANARYRRGDWKGAENYQRRHLAATREPDAGAWLLMGDILRAGGREQEAQEAYSRSLRLMERKLETPPVAAGPRGEPSQAPAGTARAVPAPQASPAPSAAPAPAPSGTLTPGAAGAAAQAAVVTLPDKFSAAPPH